MCVCLAHMTHWDYALLMALQSLVTHDSLCIDKRYLLYHYLYDSETGVSQPLEAQIKSADVLLDCSPSYVQFIVTKTRNKQLILHSKQQLGQDQLIIQLIIAALEWS